jgi:putative oxidoreductase
MSRWSQLLKTDNDVAATVARLALGLVIFPHGAQKLLGWFGGYGVSGTVGFFSGIGVPVWPASLVIAAEFLGSLGLIFGALGRVAAAGIIPVMLGAVYLIHLPNGFFMNWAGTQKGEGFEYAILAIGLALVVIIKGSGSWSLDRRFSQPAVTRKPEPARELARV